MNHIRFILIALLCTFAGTAWAVDVTLSEDNDFAMNEAGHWYLNMAPKSNTYNLTLTADDIAAGKGTFKVYDDGGKNGNYTDQSKGYLNINVPSGYILQVSGTVWTKGATGQGLQEGELGAIVTYLEVYNGNNSDSGNLMTKVYSATDGEETSFDAVTTTLNAMRIKFFNINIVSDYIYQGFDLTVTVFENKLYTIDVADGITNGTLESSASSAYANTKITLTPTPDEGYHIGTVSYNDGTDHVIKPDAKGIYSFWMPHHDITVSATFLDEQEYLWGEGNDGSAEHPYVISDKAGWDLLVTKSQTTLLFGQGLHFRLDADISNVAEGLKFFYGHLDGNHHKITLADTEKGFIHWAMGCFINDLTLKGTVHHEYIINVASNTVLTNCVFNISRSGSETLSGLTYQGTLLSTKCVYLLDGVPTYAYNENQSVRIPVYPLTIEGGAKAIRTGGTVIGGGSVSVIGGGTATIFADGFTLDGTEYYQQNVTVTLGIQASLITAATYNGNAATINSNGTATFTMPATATTATITSIAAKYIDADGTEQTCTDVNLLTSSNEAVSKPGGWYVAAGDVTLREGLTFTGDAHLILTDGATLTIINRPLNATSHIGIIADASLTIYAQSLGTGTLNANSNTYKGVYKSNTNYAFGIYSGGSITFCGGNINADGHGSDITNFFGKVNTIGIHAEGDINIIRGNVNATGSLDKENIGAHYDIETGGSLIFGWRTGADRIRFAATTINGTAKIADGQTLWNGSEGLTGTISDMSKVNGKTLEPCFVLLDDSDNTPTIAALDDGKTYNVTLTGRTLYKDGTWNTLCLPFDVTLAGSPLEGADVRELTSAELNNGTLTLNFSEDLTAIEAGKPYIIKWAEADPIVNPVFAGVTIDADADTEVSFDGGAFVGNYDPFTITSENRNSILYVGSNNKIGYRKTVPYDLGPFRAHFELKVGAEARSVVMNFEEDGEATANLSPTLSQGEGAWYTITGVKLNGAPTQRGTYIQGHKKIMIK